MTPRSWLFTPGDSLRKMQKGLGSGADALILDLEDSVAEPAKVEARRTAAEFLKTHLGQGPKLWVRINPLTTGLAEDDIAMAAAAGVDGVLLPKAEGADDVRRLAELWEASAPRSALHVLPIATETPLAIFRLETYRHVTELLGGLTWGAEDLSAAVGASTAREEDGRLAPLYETARALTIAAACAADVAPIETVYPDFRDLAGLKAYADRARRDGFLGMMAIHPDQAPIINASFTPSEEEVAHARRVVDLFAAHPAAGALNLDGKMVDMPHLKQARRVLETAGKLAS